MSLDIMEMVLEVEEEFGMRIPDADAQQIESVGDLFDATIRNLRIRHADEFKENSLDEDQVWERLKALLIHQLDLKPDQVVKSASFIHDLGFS